MTTSRCYQDDLVSGRHHLRGCPEKAFQKIVGISKGTNCVPVLADGDVVLYSYQAEFSQCLLSMPKKQVVSESSISRTGKSIMYREFKNNLGQYYRVELASKKRTESNTSASYLYSTP